MRGVLVNGGRIFVSLAGLAPSAGFLWLAVRDADLSSVRDALEDAGPGLVVLAVAVLGVFQAKVRLGGYPEHRGSHSA